MNFFKHETAVIDRDVQVGDGSKIWHFTHISEQAIIGKNVILGQNVFIGKGVVIGDGCKIQNNVSVYNGVEIEDGVFCGPSCVFTNVINPRAFIEKKEEFKRTLLKKGCSIGANATIICGITIGEYALIAAGAVVNKSVPDFALMAGVPANQIGWVCKCGETLKNIELANNLICKSCGSNYLLNSETLSLLIDIDT